MISSILVVFVAIAAWGVVRYITAIRRNIALARSTGLPYYVVPLDPISHISRAFYPIWMPLWKLVTPRRHWEGGAELCEDNWQYKLQFAPFAKKGETFIVVSPRSLLVLTASPEVTHEVTSRREAFPKPLEHYGILSMFGRNVVTTEGAVWRMHRKVTSASFNEKNSALVFGVAIQQAQGMTEYWANAQKQTGSIKTAEADTMSLALNIISYVGFGLRLRFPGQSLPVDTDSRMSKYASFSPLEGHTMTFRDSIAETLHHLLPLLLTPSFIINNIPLPLLRAAKEARDNYLAYMREFLQEKVKDVRRGDKEQGMDIMGSLVATSYQDKQDNDKGKGGLQLDDDEIIGNAFIMFLAGHETTANTMHFTLLELANNPAVQRQLQHDIDTILGRDTDPSTWDYEEKINAMQASMIGAVMNETLRVVPPVTEVPKKTTQPQTITVDGVKHTLPPETYIGLVVTGGTRNPRVWPTKPSKITDAPNDLSDWVPERWFRPNVQTADSSSASAQADVMEEDVGGYVGSDTSASMFRPVRGSFIPFSDGARSCLGRRIAIVEMLAAIAVIFQKYSVENAVGAWASDEELERMDRAQKAELYRKSVKRSRDAISSCQTMITLKLPRGTFVPLRLVKRGEERFVDWFES
ncbi:cytochrome P450 [Xylariaceae sp. FL0594]|nr:cytochrome P450 [Xylariaceae sp. FL0594]